MKRALGAYLRTTPLVAALLFGSTGCWVYESFDDATCPDEGTEHSYDSFGRGFMVQHCQSCHASRALDRQGAPPAYVFDTVEDVRRFADRIYERSAAGNASMPPGPDDPSEEERDALAEWLACGAP